MTKFKQLLLNKGIKQDWVARQAKVSKDTVSLWARGLSSPTLKHKIRLAKILGVPLKQINNIFFEDAVQATVNSEHMP